MELISRVESALAVAGRQAALMMLNLSEHTMCTPTLCAHDGTQLISTYLLASNTDTAEHMVQQQLAGHYRRCASVVSVIEVAVQDEAGHHDALKVGVFLPGTPARLTFVLPYREGPVFDREFHLIEQVGLPESFDLQRIRAALFPTLAHAARCEAPSALDALPHTLSARSPGKLVSCEAGLAPSHFLAEIEQMALELGGQLSPALLFPLRRLATLAPFALFLRVPRAGGAATPQEVEAWLDALAKPAHAEMARLVAACPADPEQAFRILSRDPALTDRALAAAGLWCAREGTLPALFALVRAMGGEHNVLHELAAALSAGASFGQDPFVTLGDDSCLSLAAGCARASARCANRTSAGSFVAGACDPIRSACAAPCTRS